MTDTPTLHPNYYRVIRNFDGFYVKRVDDNNGIGRVARSNNAWWRGYDRKGNRTDLYSDPNDAAFWLVAMVKP